MKFIVSARKLLEHLQSFDFKEDQVLLYDALFFDYFNCKPKLAKIQVNDDMFGIYKEQFGTKEFKHATQVEVVWCLMVERLLKFGFDDATIQQVRKYLSIKEKHVKRDLGLLEFCILYTQQCTGKLCIDIRDDGKIRVIDLANNECLFDSDEDDATYLRIVLYKYLKSVDPGLNLEANRKLLNLTNPELQFIELLRTNKAISNVELQLQEGKWKRAKVVETLKFKEKRYIEMLEEMPFQNLNIKKENNKVCFVNRTYNLFFN